MPEDTTDVDPGIHQVTDAEGLAILDNAARYYLNMSGEEFLRAWKEGRFAENGDTDLKVAWVSMLVPLAEPL